MVRVGTSETVLVVEDNESNLELATDLLESAGYKVLQARTGEEAIELARSELPSLILMDIGLPGIDGLATATILREDLQTSHIPIACLTAHAMKGDAARAVEAGCCGYITKPIDTRSFPVAIADLIGSTSSGRSRGR